MADEMSQTAFGLEGQRVWVAGHRGMVGSAVVRRLAGESCEVLTATSSEVNLTRQDQTEAWVRNNRPDVAIIAAAKVGGIMAHMNNPAAFTYDNLAIATNVVRAAFDGGVKKLLFLGSSCIYPKVTPQPIKEEYLLTGPLEPSNAGYAIAKIAAITLCQTFRQEYGADFISAQPTNIYGPNDNFDLVSSHVLPALIAKLYDAKMRGADEAVVWGTGEPTRDFIHVDDVADACVYLIKHYSGPVPLNIATGEDIRIIDLARKIADVVEWKGQLTLDRSKPDGTPLRKLDISKLLALGWQPKISLEAGLKDVVDWYSQSLQPAQ